MAKYVSNKFKDLQVGLSDYSESKTSLEVVGAAVIGGITTISPSGINITGVITATSFSGGDIDGEAVGIIGEDLITRNLKVTGVSTFSGITSVTSSSAFHSKQLNISGISTFNGNTYVGSGITLYSSTGVISATTFYGDGSTLTGIANTDNIISDNLKVIGVTTFGGTNALKISSGIITSVSASGIVTYYGDGSNLTGIDASTIGDLLKINVIGISTLTGETNLNGDVNVGIATTNKITDNKISYSKV